MTARYIVEAGEHLGVIARKFGYSNFSVLWDHPENAALKALRQEPTLLAPGDEVFIPDRVQLVFERLTDASHDFRAQVDTLKVTFRLLGIDGLPRKNAKVRIRVEGPETDGASQQFEQQLVTDGDGNVSVDIATHVDSGSIEIDDVEYPLRIGGMDPVETQAGVLQRLQNLGYLPLEDEPDPTRLKLAIEDFQIDNDLPVTGERADIEAKLKAVYGG